MPDDEWDAIALNYTSGTTGDPKGVVYHHRGALSARRSATCSPAACGQHPVYLWTLPMFHCNGWCFPWTISVGRRHACLPARGARARRCTTPSPSHKVTHLCGAPIVMSTLLNAPADEKKPLPHVVRVLHRGRAAAGGGAGGDESRGLQRHACLRADRDLRARRGQRLARASGTRCRSPSRRRRRRARACAITLLEALDVLDPETMQPVPRDGETHRRGDVPRQRGDEGLSEEQAVDRRGVRRRLVSLRRSRRDASRTATSSSRTAPRTSSSPAARTFPRSRSRTRSTSIPAVQAAAVVAKPDDKWGETPCAFVELKPGADGDQRRARRVVPARTSPATRCRATSCSPSCRRPARGRFRNSSCARWRRRV